MIEIKKLYKAFNDHVIFQNFSLAIHQGEVLCLLGPSGCGKSTLLKILAGLDKKYEGTINGHKAKISYVFQESRLLPWLTVKENLAYVLEGKVDHLDDYIMAWIKAVELEGFEDAYPNTLSGGMKQRVSLARAFATPHDLLLLDEPFQGLDDALKDQLMSLLYKLIQQDSTTVVMVTHDVQEAKAIGTKIIRLVGQPIENIEVMS